MGGVPQTEVLAPGGGQLPRHQTEGVPVPQVPLPDGLLQLSDLPPVFPAVPTTGQFPNADFLLVRTSQQISLPLQVFTLDSLLLVVII